MRSEGNSLHRPNTRVQDTMNETFKWLGRFKPRAAKATITRKDSSVLLPAPFPDPSFDQIQSHRGEARSVNMATSFAPVSRNPTPSTPLWGIVLLEHLDEFVTLAWYLVADGKLVEDAFSRTLAKLDTIPFEPSTPALTYS